MEESSPKRGVGWKILIGGVCGRPPRDAKSLSVMDRKGESAELWWSGQKDDSRSVAGEFWVEKVGEECCVGEGAAEEEESGE